MTGFDSEFSGYETSYESFDDRPGYSDSAAKYAVLRLGDVTGLRVLDIGCNEGYFCGAVLRDGAATAVGLDHDEPSLAEARRRFPDATFVLTDWDAPWGDRVPGLGDYDIVLLLSALHYSDDPALLIQRVRDALRPGGRLVLECGVAEGDGDRVHVVREHDTTWHFTQRGLDALLADFRVLGRWPSIEQATDPVPRYVITAEVPAG